MHWEVGASLLMSLIPVSLCVRLSQADLHHMFLLVERDPALLLERDASCLWTLPSSFLGRSMVAFVHPAQLGSEHNGWLRHLPVWR